MAGVVKFVKRETLVGTTQLVQIIGRTLRVTFGPIFTSWNKRFTCHLSHMYSFPLFFKSGDEGLLYIYSALPFLSAS